MSGRTMVVRPRLGSCRQGGHDGYRHREVVQPDEGLWIHSPQDGSRDVFVHTPLSNVPALVSLNVGQTIEYEIVSNRGKQSAENIKVR